MFDRPTLPPIPTLDETLAAQADLARLCDPETPLGNELFEPSCYYGHGTVLRLYAGVPASTPLAAVVPHAIELDAGFVWSAEITAAVPAVLAYPAYQEAAYALATTKKVVPSASPYMYVLSLVRHQHRPLRSGTIFFPSHSTHHIDSGEDYSRLAAALTRLPAEFLPLRVCMYWRDIELEHHRPFLNAGMEVVSAGHMYDPLFLFRLHHLCSTAQFASGSGVGSHIFFSVASGCQYLTLPFVGPPPPSVVDGFRAIEQSGRYIDVASAMQAAPSIRKIFLRPDPPPPAVQTTAARYFLGADNVASPADLRRLMRRLRILDWAPLARGQHSIRLQTPPAALRMFTQVSKLRHQ